MDFKKKMIIRLILALGFITFGIELIFVNAKGIATNEMLSVLGAVFIVMGIVRAIQYFIITKDDEALKKRQITETDERNVMISTKARSLTFTLYIIFAAAAIIVLYCLNMAFAAQIVGYTVCSFLLIYLVCHLIISKRY